METPRYYVRPQRETTNRWQVIDSYATNGYGNPWVEAEGLTYGQAVLKRNHLNKTWESKLPPCTCPVKEA
jgi:hypothetical protein